MAIIASILTIITLAACLMLFFIRREQKVALLVMGTMTLTLVNIPHVPLHKANLLLIVSFLLSECNVLELHIKRIRYSKSMRVPLTILVISTVVCALTTKYSSAWLVIREELFFKYFAIAYAFASTKNEHSLKPILKVSFYCLIALTFFGVLNYISQSAELVNELTRGKTSRVFDDAALGDIYSSSSRFRVQSMFTSPFDYGYTCALMLMLHLHAWYRKMEGKVTFEIAVACCLFGILGCGCRIVWVVMLFTLICYHIWSFKLGRNVTLGITAVVLFILSYNFIPAVEESVNKVTDVFVENSETGGSSIAMRSTQFVMTLYYVEGNELFGNGKGFFSKKFWNLR